MSSQDTMVKDFIESKQDKINELTIDFVKAVLCIEKEIRELKLSIKELTEEAKEEQINVKLAKKAITRLKYLIKTSEEVLDEEEMILDVIKGNSTIIADISELVQK